MFTALFVLLCAVGGLGYLHVGWRLGETGLERWLDHDNESLASFILFPVSHARERVGKKDINILSNLNIWDSKNDGDRSLYKGAMAVLWPVKMLLNLPAFFLYGGVPKTRAYLKHGHAATALLPAGDDSVQDLFAKRQRVVNEIESLLSKKEAIDAEIESRKAEMDAVFETEAIADPEVRRLVEGRKENA